MDTSVGILGYGRIGRYLRERIDSTDGMAVSFVFVRDRTEYEEDDVPLHDDPAVFERGVADLVVEAADFNAVAEHGPTILGSSDLLVLSTTALADPDVESELATAATAAGTRCYVPHGAVLGTDGLQDARPAIERVHIRTRKNPANIDFSYADISETEIQGERELYDGQTRAICAKYPRNVNSHATIALAGLGFDDTRSTLVADPDTTSATHRIVADGEATRLEIVRESDIEGVTGSYTLDSIWGSLRRVLDDRPGLHVL